MLTQLGRWARHVGRRGAAASHLTLTVYSRHDCGCCETAFKQLHAARKRFGFRLETVDVDSDPALVEAYGLTVPVVAVNGKVRFKGKISDVLLERLLRAEAANRPPE